MLQINASIAKHQDKFWCAYQTKHLRHYNAECFLAELNAELEPIADKRLLPQNDNTAFEAIKLLSTTDKLLAFYNYLPFCENTGWQPNYGVGYGEIDVTSGIIKNQISLRGYANKEQAKNWMPFILNNDLYALTDLSPILRVVKISGNDPGEIFMVSNDTTHWVYGELQGGTPLIQSPTNDGKLYGFVYSYRTDNPEFRKYYYYTVVRLDYFNRRLDYHPLPLPYDEDEIDVDYDLLWRHSNGKHHKGVVPAGITLHDDGIIASFGKDEVLSYTEYFSWERIEGYFN